MNCSRRIRWLPEAWRTIASVPVGLIVLVSSMLLLVCAPADGAFHEIAFDATDSGRIHGNLYGDGAHGVVLAHGAVFNKESWHTQAERLAEAGLRVLAIDFRGYGDSKPGAERRALHLDVLGAIAYLKTAGCEPVSVVGGSMGGGAAARAAVEAEQGSIDRLILLAHSTISNPGGMQGKKLFIGTKGDNMSARRPQFDQASEPKKWVVLEGSAHAQYILKTPQADELMQHILDWLTN